MQTDKDYIVQIRIKNAPMFRAMKKKNILTAAELSRRTNVSQQTIGKFLNLNYSPIRKDGYWHESIVNIADCLNTMPEELFPKQHIERPLKKNSIEIEMNAPEILTLESNQSNPEQLLIEKQERAECNELLNGLNERERGMIEMRYGLNGRAHTFAEIASKYMRSVERVRQIIYKAERKMKKNKLWFDNTH